ncbi:serine/threonine-protein phosphatase 2A regulatory subunit B'' subunit beta-like isoform X1 [Patiria miniata]|uniref:EF-hand domain-containing protein n=1 Tax=Patiria miniata TaxID=46514 RepID=A0A913ZGW9_PATMI|nr:serine/threonine-protein phosphatase 2A regulatory subunit B'' subunit beta-like isoform X1 [Patiria miniata]
MVHEDVGTSDMSSSLRPVLKLKVDELFLRWLSEADTQENLRENLKLVARGESVNTNNNASFQYRSGGGSPASPLLRIGSPSTPPCSPPPPPAASPSPRSPRRKSSLSRLSNSLSRSQAAKFFRDQRQSQSPALKVHVPPFYFPMGRPVPSEENEEVIQRVSQLFASLPEERAYKHQMDRVAMACKCPQYWKMPLFIAAGGEKVGYVTSHMYLTMWRRLIRDCHDDAARLFRLLAKPGCSYLVPEDFYPFIQEVVDTHPGLTFLLDAPEFHSRYIHTVIARIFYCVNRTWNGRITLPELRKSNLLSVVALLEEEDDINQILDYFSYEHFYVVYCKFWELDTDHDLFIDKKDLSRHNDHALSSRIIDRIFSPGAVLSPESVREGRMSYAEFVAFLLSEEDKKTPMSIEYWFRCMDMDGDGYLSMYELEYFYEEQINKMEALGIETLPFQDCLCQLLDLVKPQRPDRISLRDLKQCKLAYIFYDTLFNLEKYLEHEQRDPFACNRDAENEEPEPTDWEKYAAEEYELLVAEEGAQEGQQEPNSPEDVDYPDDFEPEDEEILTLDLQQKLKLSEPPQRNQWVGNNNGDIEFKSSVPL